MASHGGAASALLTLLVCSIAPATQATRESLDFDLERALERDQKNIGATQIDTNGFCPEVKIGGGKGKPEPVPMRSDMVMVKILWAQHLPSGGGVFSEDIPDTLIKFSMDSEEAQSTFVKNAWTPFFGNTCYFSRGTGWLKMELFEEDRFTSASIGVIGMSSQGLQLTRNQCNGYGLIRAVDGECLYEMYVWNLKTGKRVKGKDGEDATVTIGVKYIDSARNHNYGLNSLLESSSTGGQEVDSTAQFDKNGYCPNVRFGGGKGSAQAAAPPSSAVLVKIMSLHIPKEYADAVGSFGDRVPDPYLTFSLKKHSKDENKELSKARLEEKGKTQAYENQRDAVYQFECLFATNARSGATILFKLWEWDSFSRDDLIGWLELPVSKQQCNEGGSGECMMTVEMKTKKPNLAGPEITISLKFVEMMPHGKAEAPLSLGL